MSSEGSTPTVNGAGDAAENVQVVVRVRPLNKGEKERGEKRVVDCVADRNEVVVPTNLKSGLPRKFTFDRVYDVNATQEALFSTSVAPVVDEVLAGYSCTVFAYGQTGTGKTFTMEGKRDDSGNIEASGAGAGIIARAVTRVFDALADSNGDNHVKISFLEIYNERLDDLLAPEPSAFMSDVKPVAKSGKERNLFGDGVSAPAGPSASLSATMGGGAAGAAFERLKIVEDKRLGIKVQNLEEIPVKSADEVFSYVNKGIAKRATAETACNAQSSRSHCVFTLTIHMRETIDGEDVIRVGKLNLVDLAGSECVGRSGAKDVRAREAGNINQSLLTLGRVITALVDHLPHIPYRDSKLTRLLQDSLGGRTKTCIIATLSPAMSCYEESLSTLEYANRAKNIKNRPEANARMEKRALITAYAGEIETLKLRLAAQIAKDGVYLPTEEYEGLQSKIRQLEYEVEELNGLKVMNEEEIAALKAQLSDLKEQLEVMTDKYNATHEQLVSVQGELQETQANLAAEQTAHEESRVVLRAHAATETTLTAQAGAVLDKLQETVGDVKGLHAKVDRSTSVLAFNKRSGDTFSHASATRMTALAAETSDFAAQQHAKLSSIMAGVSTAVAKHAAQSESVIQNVLKLKTNAGQYAKSVSTSTAVLEGDVSKAAAAFTQAQQVGTEARTQQLNQLQESMGVYAEKIQQQIAQQDAALQEWLQSVVGVLAEVASTTQAFVQSHTANIAAVRQCVDSHVSSLTKSMEAQTNTFKQLEESQKAANQKATADLIASFTAMVQSYSLSQQKGLSSAVQSAVAECNNVSTNAAQFGKAAHEKVAAAQATVQSFEAGVTRSNAASAAAMKEKHGKVDGMRVATSGFVADMVKDAAARKTTLVSDMATQQTEAVASMEAVKATVTAHASRSKSGAVASGESFNKEADAIVAGVKEADGTVKAVLEDMGSTADEADVSSGKHSDAVKTWVATESNALQTFFTTTLRDNVVTGATPAKREYYAPAAFMATSPADIILQRYRAAKESGVSTPVRDQAAFGKALDVKAALETLVPIEGRFQAEAQPTSKQAGSRVRNSTSSEGANSVLSDTASVPQQRLSVNPPLVGGATAAAVAVKSADAEVAAALSFSTNAALEQDVSVDLQERLTPTEESSAPAPITAADVAQRRLGITASARTGSSRASDGDSASVASNDSGAKLQRVGSKTSLATRFGRAAAPSTTTTTTTTPPPESENAATVDLASTASSKSVAVKQATRSTSTSTRSRGVVSGPRATSKGNVE